MAYWNWARQENISTPSEASVTGLAVSPERGLLATGHDDGALKLWDTQARIPIATLAGHEKLIRAVSFSMNGGKVLATAGDDGAIRLWDVPTKQMLCVLGQHRCLIHRPVLAFSPDGRTLASSGDDGTIKLWHVDIWQEVATIKAHHGPVASVAFSPDGNTLASSGADGTVRLWKAPALAEIETPPTRSSPPKLVHQLLLKQTGPARGTVVIENEIARIDIQAVGKADWHVETAALIDQLEEGETYAIRFRAKADAPHNIRVFGHIPGPKLKELVNKKLQLSPAWQDYEVTFQAVKSAQNRIPVFIVGSRVGTVWISDLSMSKVK